LIGRLLAIAALLGQLAAWAAIEPVDVALAHGLDGICRVPYADRAPANAPAHSDHNCALCPFCLSFAAPTPLPTAAPALPGPPWSAIPAAVMLPPATAPPVLPLTTARPRGPPSSV
jgi:hypothetical protein